MNVKTEKMLKELVTGLISELENSKNNCILSLEDAEKLHLKFDDLNEKQKGIYCDIAFSNYVANGLMMLNFLNDLFKDAVNDDIHEDMMEVINAVLNDYSTTINLDYDLVFLKRG